LPRDLLLGLEFVIGRGETIRAGGRVVKNVAGFDLSRLLVGSWGTLGVVTEVTVRLRARPDQTRTIGIGVSTAPAALNELALRLRTLPFTPLASELVSAALASRLGIGGGSGAMLLCRIGGNERSLKGQVDLLRGFGQLTEMAEELWQQLRVVEATTSMTAAWRFSQLPTRFGETWSAAEQGTRALDSALMHGNPARGVVRIVARGEAAALARAAAAFDGTTAVESLPPDAWPLVTSRPAGDSVSTAIRLKFDPRGILNTGILGVSAGA